MAPAGRRAGYKLSGTFATLLTVPLRYSHSEPDAVIHVPWLSVFAALGRRPAPAPAIVIV
jgi:hypothetical protein